MSSYVFTAEIYCSDLDHSKEVELVAEYDFTPFCKGRREDGVPMEPDTDEEYEITSISSNETNPTPMELLVAAYLSDYGDCSHLIDSIKTLNWS